MYSKSPTNSLKACDCANNNVGSMQSLKKIIVTSTLEKNKDSVNNNVNKKPIEIRKEEVLAIRNRFPTKIPVIVQKFYKENHLPNLDKSKFLVPQEITMSQFQTIIRNRIRLSKNQALYLLVNNRSMMSQSLTLAEVYAEHADSDGFLYVTYASQEVFGNHKHIISKSRKKHATIAF
nr:unnamed protein product [Callosobruchus chinensis]